jgi:hypothetical protein
MPDSGEPRSSASSSTSQKAQGVALPSGHSGSSFFHHVLQEAVQRYSDVFATAALPSSAKAFKTDYGEALVRFEAARAASSQRSEIARFIVDRTREQLGFFDGDVTTTLAEHLASRAGAPALESQWFSGTPGLVPEVPFEGQVYRGRQLNDLGELLRERRHISKAAVSALRWVADRAEADGGKLDLRGHRFAVLGAGAELSPAADWLRAGAEVLWIDLADPQARLGNTDELAGTLVRGPSNDLLAQPRDVVAAIERFAQAGPVHVCMLAYAGGASKEWRLCAVMNAIVRSLDAELVRSISCFVSPTSPAHVQPEDLDAALERKAAAPLWQRTLAGLGALPMPGHLTVGNASISRSIVSIQGPSYQAAQYISKILAAETFAIYGLASRNGEGCKVTVSANVAGITRTRSLSHPVFQAAFLGAPKFGVQIFDPDTTRSLAGLMLLHDLLNPEAPSSSTSSITDAGEKARAISAQQVHGGLYCMPYALEPAIRAAAVLGLGQKPSLLFQLMR